MSDVEPIVTPPVEPAAPVEPAPSAPEIDVANIQKQARYFAKHPDAAKVLLDAYDELSGGRISADVKAVKLEIATERALRKFGLDDSDLPLIEASTPEAIMTKAEMLAGRNKAAAEALAAKEAEGKPAPKPEFKMPETPKVYKNELEAAQDRLRQFG